MLLAITTQRFRRLCQHRNQICRVEAMVVFHFTTQLLFFFLLGFLLSTLVCPLTLLDVPAVCVQTSENGLKKQILVSVELI